MNKPRLAVLMVLLVVLLFLALWVGNQNSLARTATEEYFNTLTQGDLPHDIDGSILQLATDLLEFGMPNYSVGKVHLTLSLLARAEIDLEGARGGSFTLTLKRTKAGWELKDVAPSSLTVTGDTPPRLVLKVGNSTLSKELQALGPDKLLTLQPSRVEGLHNGWLELAPYFKAFQGGQPVNLIVGMTDLDLYRHGHRLVAAVATKAYSPELIRVNLSTSGHGGIYHSQVGLSSSGEWLVTEAVTGRQILLASEAVSLHADEQGIVMDSQRFTNRLIFSPGDGNDQLEFSSIVRANGPPSYYGSLEVANFDGELVVVNEVPLERYLCYVVSGEMPTSFGPRALAVQAIVARTFALGNLYASQWRATSAHVVDSVLSQVYNNDGTSPAATAAVVATQGEYVENNGVPADVRYFSTSSGFTANSHEVWSSKGDFPGTAIPWLSSRPQFPGHPEELRGEEAFAQFIHNPPVGAYDAGSPWFRWQVTVSAGQLEEIIQDNLRSILNSNPEVILRQDEKGEFVPIQEIPAEPLGELLDLIPAQRGQGGILMAVDILGSKGKWRVQREYYIRQLLRPQAISGSPIELLLHTGSRRENFGLLPSAFVIWDLKRTEKKIESVSFYGGGFGHGVGMSQYGVRELAKQGWSREQIVEHYFPGTKLGTLKIP